MCVLTFDRPESAANIFDRKTLEELDAHVHALAEPGLGARGLVLISAKPSIFIAGADLHGFQRMSTQELEEFIHLGQQIFARIARLPYPTVAAIHGACLGGGFELALACDYRVASPDHATKIGLPETKLGIIPAWGGSTRLPRLIGFPAALDIILGGKALAAKPALKRGMIDAIAPRQHLLEAALELVRHGKRPPASFLSRAKDRAVAAIAHTKARQETEARTRGLYPAVTKAVDLVIKAGSGTEEEGLALERAAVRELAATPAARNLIRLFFAQERAKRLAVPNASPAPRAHAAAVIGAGVMGSSIAQWLSARGLHVILRDLAPAQVGAGMKNVAKLYAAGVRKHLFTAKEARDGIDRISPVAGEAPLRNVNLVIEAAVEKMEIKKSIFAHLDEITREDAMLATNTSALSISELASATRHPHRVVGLHFFNPVHQMQLVEVVVGRETAPDIAQRAVSFVQKIGKLPVLVKDSPGFLVNRILLPYMIEAGELFWRGAEVRDIDTAMLDFGMPMGPLRLTDEVGIDVAEDVAHTLSAAFPERMRVPEVLTRMLEKKMLGKKTGQGFYTHRKDGEAEPNPAAKALRPSGGQGHAFTTAALQERLALLMVNEAGRCLEEGIVESAVDVDFAMVMGTGFAPFRGGPLRYADTLGAAAVVEALERLAGFGHAYYAPCALLQEKARNNGRFHED